MLQSIDRDLGHAEYPFVTNLHDQKMPLRCQGSKHKNVRTCAIDLLLLADLEFSIGNRRGNWNLSPAN
jgi:hypothetical protein